MKKLCLLILFCSVVSAMPAYAMKVIVNDQNDRVVYSRSNKYDNSYKGDSYYSTKGFGQVNYTKAEQTAAKNYRPQPVDEYQLYELSRDLKRDLIGTTWYYDNNNYDDNNNPDNSANIGARNYQDNYTTFEDYLKRNSREAADYYTKDLANNPEELIPSGYDNPY